MYFTYSVNFYLDAKFSLEIPDLYLDFIIKFEKDAHIQGISDILKFFPEMNQVSIFKI